MLPEGRHVKSVYIDSEYSLSSVDLSGKLLIDCSTIDTATSLSIKESLTKLHPSSQFYDAPVSGGTIGAEKGTISFFVGTTEDDPALPRIQSILSSMGKQIIPCGGHSLGLTAKLCNNYLSGILTIANSEVFNIGMRAGLDPRLLYKVIGAGSSQNTICDKFCPVPNVDPDSPSSHGYRGGFRVPLMLKDFTLAMEMARQVGASTEIGHVGWRTYDTLAKVEEIRDLDVRVVFRHIGGNEQWDKELESQ
jgi:3-hydroxyisobutyrate dehydrogenase-like beta-hydroxyacid dehydrogenase